MRRWVVAIVFWSVTIHCGCSCGTVIKENESKKENDVQWQMSFGEAKVKEKKAVKVAKRDEGKVTKWYRKDGTVRKTESFKSESSTESRSQVDTSSTSTASGSGQEVLKSQSSSKQVKQDPWHLLKLLGLALLGLAIIVIWAWWSIRTWMGKSFLPWRT